MNEWSEIEDDILKTSYAENETRDSILEKLLAAGARRTRSGLNKRIIKLGLRRDRIYLKTAKPKIVISNKSPKPPRLIEDMPILDIGITIMDLNTHTCRFIVAKSRYCGEIVEDKWCCAEHFNLCYNGIKGGYNVGK